MQPREVQAMKFPSPVLPRDCDPRMQSQRGVGTLRPIPRPSNSTWSGEEVAVARMESPQGEPCDVVLTAPADPTFPRRSPPSLAGKMQPDWVVVGNSGRMRPRCSPGSS